MRLGKRVRRLGGLCKAGTTWVARPRRVHYKALMPARRASEFTLKASTAEAAEDDLNSVPPVNLDNAVGKPTSEMITASGSTSWSKVGAGGASPRNSHTVRIPNR